MISQPVTVHTGSRLHFGLFAFGVTDRRQRNFGGVGMMIDEPALKIEITPGDDFSASGPLADRAARFAQRWWRRVKGSGSPACRIEVRTAPSEHSGFGVGTQLGLSVAAALNATFDRPQLSAERLASLTGRGQRSAVGVHGFVHGGLIVEDGKLPDDNLSPLVARAEVPPQWRIVLLRPIATVGLSGTQEHDAFINLPPVSEETTRLLREEVSQRMLPAIQSGDFEAFSESVFDYGKAAGECFAAIQGGPYNGSTLAQLVAAARRLGVMGVGQSSWGPTIYCFLPNQTNAEAFTQAISSELNSVPFESVITRPRNQGATIQVARRANPSASGVSSVVSPEA